MKTFVITALALTVLATTPALAQNSRSRAQTAMANETATTRVNNNAGYEAYAFAPGSNLGPQPGVYAAGEYRGWDPDPFIRLQLLREIPDSAGE